MSLANVISEPLDPFCNLHFDVFDLLLQHLPWQDLLTSSTGGPFDLHSIIFFNQKYNFSQSNLV